MSQLTDKYQQAVSFATAHGATIQEDNGHLTIGGTVPTKYELNTVWDKVKEVDPSMAAGDLSVNIAAARDDIYGEYEVQPGDSLSAIAKAVTHGALSYQQIFEANSDQLDDPNQIQVGQKLVIPKF